MDRRSFLGRTAKVAGASLAGAPVLKELRSIGQSLAIPSGGANWSELSGMYLLQPGLKYLNHASIGTCPRPVVEALRHYERLCEENPWLYMWGGAWEDLREEVRSDLADLLQTSTDNIALTRNTTEAFSVMALGLSLGPSDEVLFSSLNHVGASEAFKRAATWRGYRARQFEFPVERVPELTADEVVALHLDQIKPETRILVVPHIDNMVGLRIPLAALSQAARAAGVEYVAVDAAQTVGMFNCDVEATGVDLFSTSPHKWLQSPKGLGVAYVSPRLQRAMHPIIATWGQRRWEDSARKYEDYGTRNLPQLMSLGDAVRFHGATPMADRERRLKSLHRHAKARVHDTAGLTWRSPQDWQLGGSLFTIGVQGKEAAPLAERLFAEGGFVYRPFTIDGTAACRLSPNVTNTEAEIDAFLDAAVA